MKSMSVLWVGVFFLALLAMAAAAPPVAHAGLNDANEPGSVLVFPYFRTGTVGTVESGTHPKTEIEVSVTCPRGATCVEGGSGTGEVVKLRAVWVCPGDTGHVCAKEAFDLQTTVNGTLYFHSAARDDAVLAGATAVRQPTCPRGFLVVWVVNAAGHPIKYDGLIGNAVVRESTTPAAAYSAVGIQGGLLLPNRALTDRNGNERLDLNGIEYMPVTGKVFGTVRFQGVNPNAPPQPSDDTYLILLTLDVLAGQPNQATSVGLDAFKADETAFSDSVDFVCWTRVLLRDINPGFTAAVMGRKGLVESTSAIQGGRAVTLLGLVETVEYGAPPNIARAWFYHLNTGGRPVLTTFGP
jgi:hypothetical protein